MDRKIYYDCEELSKSMIDIAKSGKIVCSILFYDNAVETMRCLLRDRDVKVGSLDISSFEYNGYDKEYIITLDEDLIVGIEPLYVSKFDKYLFFYADVCFVEGDVSYNAIKNSEINDCYELCFVVDDAPFEDAISHVAEIISYIVDKFEY